MPNYTFINEKTGEESTMSLSINEMEEFEKNNPEWKWVPKSGLPTLDSVRLGIKKPDDNFRDLLKTIKKGSPRSNVNTF